MSWIIYNDASTLYGWAMSQYQPFGHFNSVEEEKFTQIDRRAQTDEQVFGSIVEFDWEYHSEMHETHNAYPMAPERLNIQVEML